MKPPKLNDDEALAEWVGKIIADANDDAEREFYELPWDTHPPLRVTVTAASIERAAIEAAERGDFAALADMFERGDDLSAKAKGMMAAKLKGKFKGKRGVLKRTIIQRDLDWKIEAAEEVDKIAAILKRHYPKEQGHTDRAITIAAVRARDRTLQFGELFGKVNRQLLESYYRKSRHRRR